MTRPLILALVLALGCASSTEPRRLYRPEFRAAPTTSPDAPAGATRPPTLRVSAGTIEVLGIIDTPDPCEDLRALVSRTGLQLRLTVTARSQGCVVPMVGSYAYAALVEGLAPGEYALDVTYAYEQPGARTRKGSVLAYLVTVP